MEFVLKDHEAVGQLEIIFSFFLIGNLKKVIV